MAHLVPWILALVCSLDFCYGQYFPHHHAMERHPTFYRKYTGTHVVGGIPQMLLRSEASCLSACLSDPHCIAVDFNHRAKLCFFHGKESACGHKTYKRGCIHYTKTDYCTAAIKQYTVVELEVNNNYGKANIEVKVDNYHGNGAILQHKGGHLAACVADCKNSSWCKGVDFSAYESTCWFHSEKTICRKLAYKNDCTHVKIKNACSSIERVHAYSLVHPGFGEVGHGMGPFGGVHSRWYEWHHGYPQGHELSNVEKGYHTYRRQHDLIPLKTVSEQRPHHLEGSDHGREPYDSQRPIHKNLRYNWTTPDPRPHSGPRPIKEPYDGQQFHNRKESAGTENPHYSQNAEIKADTSPHRRVVYGVFYDRDQSHPPHVVTLPLPEHGINRQHHAKGQKYGPSKNADATFKSPHVDGHKSDLGDGHRYPHDKAEKPKHGGDYAPNHGDSLEQVYGGGNPTPHGNSYDGYASVHSKGHKIEHANAYKTPPGNSYKSEHDGYVSLHSKGHKTEHANV